MKKKLSLSMKIIYLFSFALVGAFIFINYFRIKLGPGLITCAEDEVRHLATIVMNNCIKKYVDSMDGGNDILEIERNGNNDIVLISYDTKKIMNMTTEITKTLERDLNYMSEGEFEKIDLDLNTISYDYYTKLNEGIAFSVSLGSATGNSLLANIGPDIPLKLSSIQDVKVSVDSNVKEYGLNNAMIEVVIKIEVTIVIHMPFLSDKLTIANDIPLSMEIIEGNVPSYYLK